MTTKAAGKHLEPVADASPPTHYERGESSSPGELEFLRIAAGAASPQVALEGLCQLIGRTVDYDWCRLSLYDEHEDTLTTALTIFNGRATYYAGRAVQRQPSFLAEAMAARSYDRRSEVSAGDLAVPAEIATIDLIFDSVVVAPLIRAGGAVGTIDLGRIRGEPFSDGEFAAIRAIAEPVGLVAGLVSCVEEAGRVTRVEERTRLALDLHNSVVQALIRIVLQLELAERRLSSDLKAARSEIRGARELARMCLEDSRRSLLDLQPAPENQPAVAQAISRELGALEMTGIRIAFSCEDSLLDVSAEGSHLICGIVHEAVINIRKHARASFVTATIRRDHDVAEIRVSDDGVGFERGSADEGSYGKTLTALAKRALAIGGELRIESEPGRGTSLTARVPTAATQRPARVDAVIPVEERVRVLLVDEQSLFRQGLRQTIERCPDLRIVGESGNAEEAITQVEALAPDVALVDVKLQGGSGIDLVAEISRLGLKTRVLMLSADQGNDLVLQAIRAGASGYVLKDIAGASLVDAIRAVHRGEMLLHPAARRDFAAALKNMVATGLVDPLSEREREVLQLIATGRRNKEIARQLCLAEATIKYHVTNLLNKLGAESRTEAVVSAQKMGLLSRSFGT